MCSRLFGKIKVFDVKCVQQKTSFECGYRMIYYMELFIMGNFDIDYLSIFDYNQFIYHYINTVRFPYINEN